MLSSEISTFVPFILHPFMCSVIGKSRHFAKVNSTIFFWRGGQTIFCRGGLNFVGTGVQISFIFSSSNLISSSFFFVFNQIFCRGFTIFFRGTHTHPDRHGDSMTESGQWGRCSEILLFWIFSLLIKFLKFVRQGQWKIRTRYRRDSFLVDLSSDIWLVICSWFAGFSSQLSS